MNTKTMLTVKTDKSLKRAAQIVAEEIGIPLGTLVNSFLRQFVRSREVSFSSEYIPSKELLISLAEGEREIKSGKLKRMTLDELIKDLNS